jgi:hypothetical protein
MFDIKISEMPRGFNVRLFLGFVFAVTFLVAMVVSQVFDKWVAD